MKAARFDYHRARDLPDALTALQGRADAKIIAGGQSLGPMLNLRLARPGLLVDVSRIAELGSVSEEGAAIRIGSAVTHAALEDGAAARGAAADFIRVVAAGIGYRSVRNRGTIGGSLAHADPAADWPTALTAIDAEAVLVSAKGQRKLPVSQLILGALTTSLLPDEVIESVRVPRLSPAARCGYCKLTRKTGELAYALAAVVIDRPRNFARVVSGAVEGKPIIIDELSDALLKQPATDVIARIPPAVARTVAGAEAYQQQALAAALRRAVEQACAP